MKTISDNELDLLIRETFEREQLLSSVQDNVMKTLRRTERQRLLRRWSRRLVMAFGLPLLLGAYAYLLVESQIVAQQPLAALFAGAAVVAFSLRFVHQLSPE